MRSDEILNSKGRGFGMKYRVLYNGEIIERYTGKILGYIENYEDLDRLWRSRGKKLDEHLKQYFTT